ncbi:PLD nuclease N-terminal domain-containing protein [Sutcliffiella deserti]|uniref:PLD nuclease N-terminal domain-containing protein n=1 Tax=Sutcliffiella deserti TaxID=2875501 RepID=UPI001CBBD650|nr:PLD nuclease N-terminal domain-containing protein [Sutcliffiella deserti]
MELNWAILTPILILQAILTITALVSCIKQETTNGPKWMWILLILLLNTVGPILYFVIGRKNQ